MSLEQESAVPGTPTEHDPVQWFEDHYHGAAGQVIDFFGGDGITLEGKTVCDIGSGDGLIDLGVFHEGKPERLIGYDVRPVDTGVLLRSARAAGVADELPDPDRLSFVASQAAHIPADDSTFDLAFTWSVFEHVNRAPAMFKEIRRVLKPDGVLFLQLWPFFNSAHGGHLWLSISEPFAQLRMSHAEVEARLVGKPGTDPSRSGEDEFRSLNRLTLDDLQNAMLFGGLRVSKIEVITGAVHLPLDLAHLPLSSTAISGVKLLAVPH